MDRAGEEHLYIAQLERNQYVAPHQWPSTPPCGTPLLAQQLIRTLPLWPVLVMILFYVLLVCLSEQFLVGNPLKEPALCLLLLGWYFFWRRSRVRPFSDGGTAVVMALFWRWCWRTEF